MIKQLDRFKNSSIKSIILLTAFIYIVSTISIAIFFHGAIVCNDMIMLWLLLFPIILFIFIPAFISISFLYKKITRTVGRIFLFSIIIPLYNLILYFIDSFLNAGECGYSELIGASWLFLILPTTLIIAIVIPKKFLHKKKLIIITTILMWFAGWFFILSIIPINAIFYKSVASRTWIWNPFILQDLKEYDSVIEYIENYKVINGVYPHDLNSLNINAENYPYFRYTTENKQSDFILAISKYKYFEISSYRYCSSRALEKCNAFRHYNPKISLNIGKWVYYRYDFD